MRIAFSFLTYGKDIFGGIENALFNLTQGLAQNGHEVFVFTSNAYINDFEKELPAKVFASQYLPSKYDGNVTNLISLLEAKSGEINSDFEDFIARYKPDALVVVDPIWGILQVTNYIQKIIIPAFMSYHIANKWPQTQEFMKESFKLPYKKYFAVSEFLISDIKNSFDEAANININILPNSVDQNLYVTKSVSKENYIFCNSRIAKGKDVDVLVKAFGNIVKDFDIRLKLCSGKFPFGETSEDIKEIERLIEQLGIKDKVDFLPLLNWNQVPEITLGAKLVVLPSRYETFGIAALEASIAGIPLISANATNFKHLVKESAVFFEPGNVLQLENAISTVLNNYDQYKEKAVKLIPEFAKYSNKQVAEGFINEIFSNNML